MSVNHAGRFPHRPGMGFDNPNSFLMAGGGEIFLRRLKGANHLQINRLQLIEMIDELFTDTVVIRHHEKLFAGSSNSDRLK